MYKIFKFFFLFFFSGVVLRKFVVQGKCRGERKSWEEDDGTAALSLRLG